MIDSPVKALSSGQFPRKISFTVAVTPEGKTRTLSPGFMVPSVMRPQTPRKSWFGRFTYCTGMRIGLATGSPTPAMTASTVFKYSINVGPLYHGVRGLGVVMLSPSSAESGIACKDVNFKSPLNWRYSASMRWNTASSKPAWSILLIANTMWRMPIIATMRECRRVCVNTPLRASMRITASSAVDAPVAMLRVYCSWPGVSATINFRLSVLKKRYATSMVMPCSRSAWRPSTSKAKSIFSPWVPYCFESFSSACNWSSKIHFDSCSRRPMRVDLPSSTLPQVMKRNVDLSRWDAMKAVMSCAAGCAIRNSPPASSFPSSPVGRCRSVVPGAPSCAR